MLSYLLACHSGEKNMYFAWMKAPFAKPEKTPIDSWHPFRVVLWLQEDISKGE